MLLQTNIPVPKDIPLDLPLPEWLLVTLLIVSFLFHIVFVNLMVGGSIVTLWAQIKGLKNEDYDRLAHEIASTVTVNKSLAVVLGVAPLLSINTLYTVYFYSANALTGFAWIMIIPLVTIAFLLTYLHKYTWESLRQNKAVHIAIIALAVAIFLVIPLIFLANVNLMMFPDKWPQVQGFISALMLPNVLPRYFEFIGACITVTGVFLAWYNGRQSYPVEEIYTNLTRYDLKRNAYSVAIIGLATQIFFGLIVFFSLPSKGIDFKVVAAMGLAGVALVVCLWYCYQAISGSRQAIDAHFSKIVACVALFLALYGGSRQLYRHNSLHKHQQLMAGRTAAFLEDSRIAREHPVAQAASETDAELGEFAKGAVVFNSNCAACHQKDLKLIGPPIIEMVTIYAQDEEGLKNWIKAPGKKRADYPQMPGFSQLSPDDLNELARYILSFQP